MSEWISLGILWADNTRNKTDISELKMEMRRLSRRIDRVERSVRDTPGTPSRLERRVKIGFAITAPLLTFWATGSIEKALQAAQHFLK